LIRSSIGATPSSLVYKIEAVLPIEIAMSSLRVIGKSEIPESKWTRVRYEELVMMDEWRL